MLKVAIVGCGFMGRMHANVYSLLENANLVGVYDRRPEKAQQFAEEFGCQAFESFEDLLGSGVDAVDICLPTYLHKEFTVRAAEAGKHVMCEKPMALSVEDADAMASACESAGVRLMLGHCIRFWPEYAKLKEIKDSGGLGELLSVNLIRFGAFPSWSSDNWLADESKAGGGALDMHIHDTDYALYLLGQPDSITSWGSIDDRGVSQIFTTMTFGRTVAHLEGGWNLPSSAPFKHAFRAIFERGLVMMDAGPLTIYEEGKEPVAPEFPTMKAAGGGNISDLGGYYHELKYFVDRVQSGEPFEVVTPETSRKSLRIALEEIRQAKERM